MAANRPDDLDPEAWFEAAIRIDQAHTANAAFQASIHLVLVVPEIVPTEVPPPFQEIAEEASATPPLQPQFPDVLNIKGMSAEDIRELWKWLFGTQEEFPVVPVNTKELPTSKPPTVPSTPSAN